MKRFVCICLLLCLLTGCAGLSWGEQYDAGGPETATIAYVPLDNRPVNTTRVRLLARCAGFRLVMPQEDLYRTALDGQPRNANGEPYGDGEALLRWLEGCQADYYVLSVDQILSGGLVNSRCKTDITGEWERIDRLLALLEGKQTILLDTLMRLAPTVGYGGCTLEVYQALRDYGSLPRLALSGPLTAEQVIAGYSVPTDLDEGLTAPYLAARARKLRLSEYLLTALSQREEVSIFYGVDDSSPETTIQTNEIALIGQRLLNGALFAGTDEMGLLAVARILCTHYSHRELPGIGIRYFGAEPQAPADEYDMGSLEKTLLSHIWALGLECADRNCDLELLIFGGGETEALLARYRENAEKGIPTVLVDLHRGGVLPRALLACPELDVSCLLAYSGWNTAGNSIGIALSGGVARYLYLKYGQEPVQGAGAAFLEGLALSFAKDVAYARIRPQLEEELAQEGASGGNFYPDGIDPAALGRRAMQLMGAEDPLSFEALRKWLEGKEFLTSLAPQATGRIPALSVTEVRFPWYRTFEAEITIQLGL